MWVVHEPSSCTDKKGSLVKDKSEGDLKALIDAFQDKDVPSEERDSKMQAILNILES